MHLISIGFLTILLITCGVVFGTESFTIENEKVISGDGWVVAIADIDSDLMQVVQVMKIMNIAVLILY